MFIIENKKSKNKKITKKFMKFIDNKIFYLYNKNVSNEIQKQMKGEEKQWKNLRKEEKKVSH